MMKKSIVLISLILLLTMSVLSSNLVSASVGAANFLPNNFQSLVDTHQELVIAEDTAEYITTMLANYNSPYGCYYSYGESCTVSSYCTILSSLKNNYDQAIVFSKGHRGYPYYDDVPRNVNHISLLDNDTNHLRDDEEIFSNTDTENKFTFIWHCETAVNYTTGIVPMDTYGPYGQPYCWTHNQWLNKYGSTGNQVYLGWTGGSPQYVTTASGAWNYAHVAYYFWYYMCDGDTVDQALNHVASTIYGTGDFDNTVLKNWLIVWGNMNLGLP